MHNSIPVLSDGITYAVSDISHGNLSFRHGDSGAVVAGRQAFLRQAGIRPEDCIVMQVEHGERVVPVGREACGAGALSPESSVTAEALMTAGPDVALFLLTADCLPISYHDPERGVIALAHLGWRPSALGLAAKVVREMTRVYGSDPRDIRVHVGPGIHTASYAFDTLEQAAAPEWQPFILQDEIGKWHIDLVGLNVAQLEAAGIMPEHISADPRDTAADPHFFSHYRAARTGEPEGRFATVLALAVSS